MAFPELLQLGLLGVGIPHLPSHRQPARRIRPHKRLHTLGVTILSWRRLRVLPDEVVVDSDTMRLETSLARRLAAVRHILVDVEEELSMTVRLRVLGALSVDLHPLHPHSADLATVPPQPIPAPSASAITSVTCLKRSLEGRKHQSCTTRARS
jgi:hypothetical protein